METMVDNALYLRAGGVCLITGCKESGRRVFSDRLFNKLKSNLANPRDKNWVKILDIKRQT